MFTRKITAALAICAAFGTPVGAQTKSDTLQVDFVVDGVAGVFEQSFSLNTAQIASHYRPSASCNGPCVAPLSAARDVVTIAEREVIEFVTGQIANGTGLLVDSRDPDNRATGFIAASLNIPAALLRKNNPFLNDILMAMGGQVTDGALTFAQALPIVVFDDGPSTGDAPAFINLLIDEGYPADKLSYYRGGMLVWTALGLSTNSKP